MNPVDIDRERIAQTTGSGLISQIEFSEPNYTPALLEQIDGLCREYGRLLQVRFWGHRKSAFDAGILRHIPSVQNLAVDCMNDIQNEGQIAKLEHLRRLSFQVQNFDHPQFLSTLNTDNLEVLQLMDTRKSNLDLSALARAQRLRKLTLGCHRKGIERLTGALLLEQLILWGQPKAQSLAFIGDLKALRHLRIVRGGREALDDFKHDTLQCLIVTWVNGLRTLGSLRRFKKLEGLAVHDQIRLSSIDLTGASIKMIGLDNCKSLKELVGIEDQRELEQFTAVKTGLPLDQLRDRTWPKSLRVLRLWSSSKKWNEATRVELARRGYAELGGRWFPSDLD